MAVSVVYREKHQDNGEKLSFLSKESTRSIVSYDFYILYNEGDANGVTFFVSLCCSAFRVYLKCRCFHEEGKHYLASWGDTRVSFLPHVILLLLLWKDGDAMETETDFFAGNRVDRPW